jgi:hypothetical protein
MSRILDRELPFFRRESAAEWDGRLARLFRCASDGRGTHPTLARTARCCVGAVLQIGDVQRLMARRNEVVRGYGHAQMENRAELILQNIALASGRRSISDRVQTIRI